MKFKKGDVLSGKEVNNRQRGRGSSYIGGKGILANLEKWPVLRGSEQE